MSKRSEQLFEYLLRIASNIEAAAEIFQKDIAHLPDPALFAESIKQFELDGDTLTSELLTLLNSTYVTPLEREDFLELAYQMDDVVDGLEACAVRFDLFHIHETNAVMGEFAQNIREGAAEIVAAMRKLCERDFQGIRKHTDTLNQLEKKGDELLRHALKELFQVSSDALLVIKLKEIYEILESITDRVEDVGDVLESVVIKNA